MARRGLSLLSWCAAATGLALGLLHAVNGDAVTDSTTVWSLGVFAVSLVLGALVNKPPTAVMFGAIASVSALTASLLLERGDAPTTSALIAAEYLLLSSQAVLVIALVVFVRRRLGSRATSFAADGVIVAAGAWVVSWVVLVRPSIASSAGAPLTIGRGTTLCLAIIVVFLLSVLLFSDTAPAVSVTFLGIAVALQLTGVILRAVSLRPGMSLSESTVHAPMIMALVMAGAGLIHPTARDVYRPGAPRMSPPLMTRLVTTTASMVVPIIVLTLTSPDGPQDKWVRTVSIAVLAVVVMVRVVVSVRTNADTQAQLVRTALTDSLTGLPNRVLMLEHIQTALAEAWGSSRQPTVLFIDVDRFKNINDSLGHSIGDDILTVVATRLSASVPAHSTVARIAGDEFIVLDPATTNATQSVLLAESVLDSFREPVRTAEGDMFVTASIGVAHAPKGVPMTADQLVRHADTAMYRAKDAGRNCIALFDDSMLETVTKRLDVETALYRALERNELRLLHQPIVDVSLGLVVGFEALMRWDRGDGATVSPAEFIPIAEETGTIVPLGSWAIHDALRQLREWIDTAVCSPSTTMSVNVSPRQLGDPQFVTVVSEALASTGVPPGQLWLEVTESVMISEPAQALSSLRRLTSLGVRIAVDDFGTGYSSLSLLQRFPIQCIKIDRAFVKDIAEDDGTRNIVRTIIAMATAMGADIIAEGVEEVAQLETLESLRCNKAQGYLIARPTAPDDIPALVSSIQNVDSIWRGR